MGYDYSELTHEILIYRTNEHVHILTLTKQASEAHIG